MYQILLFGICLVLQSHVISAETDVTEVLTRHLAINNCDHFKA